LIHHEFSPVPLVLTFSTSWLVSTFCLGQLDSIVNPSRIGSTFDHVDSSRPIIWITHLNIWSQAAWLNLLLKLAQLNL